MSDDHIWTFKGSLPCGCLIVAREAPREAAAEYCPLHAAAPDLLAACDAAERALGATVGPDSVISLGAQLVVEQLRAAIAKAKGTPPAHPEEV